MNPIDISGLNTWLASQGAAGRIAVKEVVIEDDLFAHLPALLATQNVATRPVCVVMDQTPMRRGRKDAKQEFMRVLAHACQPQVILLGAAEAPPHADLAIAEDLVRHLPPQCLLISFGSGTITDLAKHARFLADQNTPQHDHRTFVCLPTACTVTAFSSALAVLAVAGVKRTIPSQNPDYTWIDLATLAGAPADLTRAGVGDLLARGVAYADWYLAGLLGVDESYSDVPRLLLADHEAQLPQTAAALRAGDRGAFRTLMEALLLAGYAMSVVGQTTPISGWEHVMSHYLDLMNAALRKPLNLHGLQVAAGTFVATRAYNEFLKKVRADDLLAAGNMDMIYRARAQIDRHFAPIDRSGAIREELIRDYLPKAHRWQAAAPKFRQLAEDWPSGRVQQEISARLMPLETLDAIAAALDIPRSLSSLESLPTPTAPADTVRYSHLVRQRFTLGDMLSALGWLDERRIARWLAAG
jgi:glycerol-1-phosphate dehydrogenase [NAD(P)+]